MQLQMAMVAKLLFGPMRQQVITDRLAQKVAVNLVMVGLLKSQVKKHWLVIL